MPPIPDAAAQTASRMVENGGYGAALIILGLVLAYFVWRDVRNTTTITRMTTEQQQLALESARAFDRTATVLADVKAGLSIIAERTRK